MLRLAAWRLCEAGLVPNMLVHDGILFELENQEQVARAVNIMRSARRDVCHGLEVGVDIDQRLEHGARYQDNADGKGDVGDHHACPAGRQGNSFKGPAVNYVMRQGSLSKS